jgi:hypothetical protein
MTKFKNEIYDFEGNKELNRMEFEKLRNLVRTLWRLSVNEKDNSSQEGITKIKKEKTRITDA